MSEEFELPDDIDLEADAVQPAADLHQITEAAAKMIALDSEIAAQENKLKDLKEQHRVYECETLPSLMNEVGISKLTLGTGHEIEIKDVVKAALPSAGAIEKAKGDKRAELEAKLHDGLEFIRSVDGGALIKNFVALEFSRGQDEIVNEFVAKAQELGIPAKNQQTVAPQTLSKFVSELMEKGVAVPMDILGVFAGQVAKVKVPKK